MALDIAQCTDERQRLEWSFRWDLTLNVRRLHSTSEDVGRRRQRLHQPAGDDQHRGHHGRRWGGGAGAEGELLYQLVSSPDMMYPAWAAVWTSERQDESKGDIWSSWCWRRRRDHQDWVRWRISQAHEVKRQCCRSAVLVRFFDKFHVEKEMEISNLTINKFPWTSPLMTPLTYLSTIHSWIS